MINQPVDFFKRLLRIFGGCDHDYMKQWSFTTNHGAYKATYYKCKKCGNVKSEIIDKKGENKNEDIL